MTAAEVVMKRWEITGTQGKFQFHALAGYLTDLMLLCGIPRKGFLHNMCPRKVLCQDFINKNYEIRKCEFKIRVYTKQDNATLERTLCLQQVMPN